MHFFAKYACHIDGCPQPPSLKELQQIKVNDSNDQTISIIDVLQNEPFKFTFDDTTEQDNTKSFQFYNLLFNAAKSGFTDYMTVDYNKMILYINKLYNSSTVANSASSNGGSSGGSSGGGSSGGGGKEGDSKSKNLNTFVVVVVDVDVKAKVLQVINKAADEAAKKAADEAAAKKAADELAAKKAAVEAAAV